MNSIDIKLGKGRKLFHPATRVLMVEEVVYTIQPNQFWNRRIKDGDVILIKQKNNQSIKKESKS